MNWKFLRLKPKTLRWRYSSCICFCAANIILQGEEIDTIIQELEESIAQYKEEYAVLINEANKIKSDLQHVEDKVSKENFCIGSFSSAIGNVKINV